jgi:Arc/MetJ-type ribon-helix-helix transcriptional regulator
MQVVPESRSARADRLRPLVRAQVDALGSAAAVGRAAGVSPATVRSLVAGAAPQGGNLDALEEWLATLPRVDGEGGDPPGDAEDGLVARQFAAAFQAWVEERVGTGPYRSVTDVLVAAQRALEFVERIDPEALRSELEAADALERELRTRVDQLDRGEGIPAEEAIALLWADRPPTGPA